MSASSMQSLESSYFRNSRLEALSLRCIGQDGQFHQDVEELLALAEE